MNIIITIYTIFFNRNKKNTEFLLTRLNLMHRTQPHIAAGLSCVLQDRLLITVITEIVTTNLVGLFVGLRD